MARRCTLSRLLYENYVGSCLRRTGVAFGCALGGLIGDGLWPTGECGSQTAVMMKASIIDYSHNNNNNKIIIIIIKE